MTRHTQVTTPERREESLNTLRELLTPGTTVYTANKGREGAFIKLYVVSDGRIRNITWHVAHAIGRGPVDRDGEWVIHNPVIGMDRGFDIVYDLGRHMFGDLTVEERERIGRESSLFLGHGTPDAGYMFNHEWL